MPDIALLRSLLPDTPILAPFETASTNSDAREWLKSGAEHGSLVVTGRQTAGRGRMGRAFVSQPGGLYMSIVLKSDLPAGVLTTLCAVAVRRAVIELTGMTPGIKWVNDLQLNGKKICGILCEGVWQGDRLLGVIAGIGLNVCQQTFPEELREIAASLYPEGASPIPHERFAAAIHTQVMTLLHANQSHMDEYRRACVTLGQRVSWQTSAETREGMAVDVDATGALLIDTDAGRVRLAAGEVSVKAAK
ncbi:MAG: biotin--[Clostridia bacterium]|nr:biotin--[acetyl-CoA-carboxylase] ligase [Clostridia bacterium]